MDKRILVGTKGKDEFGDMFLHPSSWVTVLKMWIENGEIKIWERTKNKKICKKEKFM